MKQKKTDPIEKELQSLQASISQNCKQLTTLKDALVSKGSYEEATFILSIESHLLDVQQKIFSFLEIESEVTTSKKNTKRYRLS